MTRTLFQVLGIVSVFQTDTDDGVGKWKGRCEWGSETMDV